MHPYNFDDLKSVISQHSAEALCAGDLLKIGQDGALSSYYTPFDTINKNAKVVLVGICPGKVQWRNAVFALKNALNNGCSESEALHAAKAEGAFSGPMRKNLVKMLDHLGLAEKLQIPSTASLFDQNQHLTHMTSVLGQCILNQGNNYSGSSPSMLKNSFLKQHIETYFIPEIQLLSNAVYIPLGKSVIDVLYHLSSLGYLSKDQILDGFPHPSGANAERIQYFLGQKSAAQLSSKTNPKIIDDVKSLLIEKINHLKFN